MSGLPNGWGPGPWEFTGLSWTDKSNQFGNLRPWVSGERTGSAPIVTTDVQPPAGERIDKRAGTRAKRETPGALKALCWCGRSIVLVETRLVRHGLTESCSIYHCEPPKDSPACVWRDWWQTREVAA